MITARVFVTIQMVMGTVLVAVAVKALAFSAKRGRAHSHEPATPPAPSGRRGRPKPGRLLRTRRVGLGAHRAPDVTEALQLVLLLVMMLVASVTTFQVSRRWYVPLALAWTLAFLAFGSVVADLSLSEMALTNWITGLIWGLGCIGVVTVAMAVGVAVPRLHPLFADERVVNTSGAQVAHKSLIEVPLGTVLLEEIVFRSVLLGMVTSMFGTVAGVLGSSFLFGLWHILPALEMHDSHSLTSQLGIRMAGEAGHRGRHDPGDRRRRHRVRDARRAQRQRAGPDGAALGHERARIDRRLAGRASPGTQCCPGGRRGVGVPSRPMNRPRSRASPTRPRLLRAQGLGDLDAGPSRRPRTPRE